MPHAASDLSLHCLPKYPLQRVESTVYKGLKADSGGVKFSFNPTSKGYKKENFSVASSTKATY